MNISAIHVAGFMLYAKLHKHLLLVASFLCKLFIYSSGGEYIYGRV